jgi:TonB family protein
VLESQKIEPGQLVDGRYRIVRKIATGGMGTVFEATHVKIGRTVALKILHSDLAGDPDLVRRFLNEARAVGTLGHPHIVASTDFGELPGHIPYLVLEYLAGQTLGHEIFVRGRISVKRALRIAAQIASALAAAHARGVVHRDLTAENVFLTRARDDSDHVKVLDFGISKFLMPLPSDAAAADTAWDASPTTTRRGLTMGTPEFMAPEQISDPSSVDARVDIYALGVIIHYMLTGQTPYGRLPPHILLSRVLTAPVPVIERPDVPNALRRLLVRALAKGPDDRYATMAEMETALNELSVTASSAAEESSGVGRWLSRHRKLTGIGATAVMALAAIASIRALVREPESRSGDTDNVGKNQISRARATDKPSARPPSSSSPVPAGAARPSEVETIAAELPAVPARPRASTRSAVPRPSGRARPTTPRRLAAGKRTAVAPADEAAAAPPAPEPLPGPQPSPTPKPRPVGPRPGSIEPAAIQMVVRSRLPEIERCYARGKMDDPELRGRVTVRIRIAPNGVVTSAGVESSSLSQSGVESCIVEAVQSWTFPAPAGGQPAVISYPFNLR